MPFRSRSRMKRVSQRKVGSLESSLQAVWKSNRLKPELQRLRFLFEFSRVSILDQSPLGSPRYTGGFTGHRGIGVFVAGYRDAREGEENS